MKQILFTQQGYQEVLDKKEKLLSERKYAVEDLRKAREMGDLSENGYYKSARMKLSSVDRELRFLTMKIRYGKAIPKSNTDSISINSQVKLNDGEKEYTYTLVGQYEADPEKGLISIFSPLGKLLLGRKVGEKLNLILPSKTVAYTVLTIN